MKLYGEMQVYLHSSTQMERSMLVSRPLFLRFTSGKRATTAHWKGGWMGPRGVLDALEKKEISCLAGNHSTIPRPTA